MISTLKKNESDWRNYVTRGSSGRSKWPLVSGRRTRDPKGLELMGLRPTSTLYTAVLPYQSYHPVDSAVSRHSHASNKVMDFEKRVNLELSNCMLSANDLTMVPTFVTFCSWSNRKSHCRGSGACRSISFFDVLCPESVRDQSRMSIIWGGWCDMPARGWVTSFEKLCTELSRKYYS